MITMPNINLNRGFTLIEVLVAMLIIAVGLLSIVALQLQGLKYNHEAYLRSQINFLAYEVADLMRANNMNAVDYVGNFTVPVAAPGGCVQATAADAANDLACWRQQVSNVIPPGSIANITAAGTRYTVTMGWIDKGTAAIQNITYTFDITPPF